MNAGELPKEITEYREQWVALSEDNLRVVGAGEHLQDAIDAARETGHDEFRLHYVFPTDARYVPSA